MDPKTPVQPYQALYRRERPQTFAEMVGQSAAMNSIQGAIKGNRVSHAYLFSGTRGSGKTSAARLLALSLNCLERKEGESEPCGHCESCKAIANGTASDVIEIDAASSRGIDEIRQIRERVQISPRMGKRKIYIFDEVHMLTGEAFNALLKTLEEPPPHVVFIFCTTQPEKIPTTVLSRCQNFTFIPLTNEQIIGQVVRIAAKENISLEPGVAELIAEAADGSMREAVNKLDQLMSVVSQTLSVADVRVLLGVVDHQVAHQLYSLVASGNAGAATLLLRQLWNEGVDVRPLTHSLMKCAKQELLLAMGSGKAKESNFHSVALDRLLQIDRETRNYGDPAMFLEMTLVQMAAISQEPDLPVETIPAIALIKGGPPAVAEDKTVIDSLPQKWKAVLSAFNADDPLAAGFFRQAKPSLIDGNKLRLEFSWPFHFKKAQENRDKLTKYWPGEIIWSYVGKQPLEEHSL